MVLLRKGIPIWALLIIVVTPMIILIGAFTIGLVKIADYKEFIRDLDNSIVYGIENDSIRAKFNGVSTRVSHVNADLIFQEVISSGYIFIREEKEKPKNIFLDFGNGGKMWIHYFNPETLIYRYIGPNGKEKKYLTNKITRFITFERLISTDWKNSPWDE